jgi:hypothetical protein
VNVSSSPPFGIVIAKLLRNMEIRLLTDLEVYFHVVLTRLTLVDRTMLFLKPPDFDKTRLVAFHSFTAKKVQHYKECA